MEKGVISRLCNLSSKLVRKKTIIQYNGKWAEDKNRHLRIKKSKQTVNISTLLVTRKRRIKTTIGNTSVFYIGKNNKG